MVFLVGLYHWLALGDDTRPVHPITRYLAWKSQKWHSPKDGFHEQQHRLTPDACFVTSRLESSAYLARH